VTMMMVIKIIYDMTPFRSYHNVCSGRENQRELSVTLARPRGNKRKSSTSRKFRQKFAQLQLRKEREKQPFPSLGNITGLLSNKKETSSVCRYYARGVFTAR
jgi:hypothetical protein